MKSREVAVTVVYRLHHAVYSEILRELGEDRDTPDVLRARYIRSLGRVRSWQRLRDFALTGLVSGAPELDELEAALNGATSRTSFIEALRSANRIEVDDDGDGMSLELLSTVYLTIGTSHRANQKRARYAVEPEGHFAPAADEEETDEHAMGDVNLFTSLPISCSCQWHWRAAGGSQP